VDEKHIEEMANAVARALGLDEGEKIQARNALAACWVGKDGNDSNDLEQAMIALGRGASTSSGPRDCPCP
jgi:hypothetical protein